MLKQQEIALKGQVISRGIAIGIPFLLNNEVTPVVPATDIAPANIAKEIARYRKAVQESKGDLMRIKEELAHEGVTDGVSILDAHIQILDDPTFTERIEEEIRSTQKNADYVFSLTMQQLRKKLEAVKDPFFQSRIEDIYDIAKRILAYLRKMKRISLCDIPKNSIVFSPALNPTEAAEAKRHTVSAFVTQMGGDTSHTGIVAKAKGIPYVASVHFAKLPSMHAASFAIVDALEGKVILYPTEATLEHYRQLKQQIQHQNDVVRQSIDRPSETLDGLTVRLSANVEVVEDFSTVLQNGGDGVGLFRSEYIVLQRGGFPSEEEQYEIYKDLVGHLQGRPVVIRAFDIGLDKMVCQLNGQGELNPALGCRAIRFLLQEPELFRAQLRAIVRAAVGGDVRLLLPMISSLEELREAKRLVQEECNALKKDGVALPDHIPLGCMIEVPSAAMIVDLIAQECDFLSIGTNDLVQYALAVDRAHQGVLGLHTSTHPGVVRLLKRVVDEAAKWKVPVCVCGEMASDPHCVPLLIGLGIRELSVACRFLPVIKHVIRSVNLLEAKNLAAEVLSLKTGAAIQQALVNAYEQNSCCNAIGHL